MILALKQVCEYTVDVKGDWKMSNSGFLAIRRMLALILGMTAISAPALSEPGNYVVQDARPLAVVAKYLAERHRQRIGYEEPPYQPAGISSRTIAFTVPAADAMSVSSASPKPSPLTWGDLSRVIDDYGSQVSTERFEVFQGDETDSFYVAPSYITTSRGQLERFTPILDARVTVQPAQRTVLQAVVDLCAALQKTTGYRVVPGTVPMNLLVRNSTALGADGETGRHYLYSLLRSLPAPVSWELFFSPTLNVFALNLYILPTDTR